MGAYKSFAITVSGNSHIKQGKDCQDASFNCDDTDMSMAIVTDGHGDDNCFRSNIGSKFAAVCAEKGIKKFVEDHGQNFLQSDFDKAVRDLVKHIIAAWQVSVEQDYTDRSFSPEELKKADEKHRKRFEAGNGLNKVYGTTLIAAAITQHYWVGIHVGDGRLTALYPNGSFDQPVPWDQKCFLNRTTSICDDDAFERARYYFSFHDTKTPPAAVFLCSDGIDDNYPVYENEKYLFKLYRTIALTFAEAGFDKTWEQLKDLANKFATEGKGDDTSIAGFIDMEALKLAVPVWQKQITEEEAAAEKSEKEEPKASTETKPETAKPKPKTEETEALAVQNVAEASAAYKKHMESARRDDSNRGVFITGNGIPEGRNMSKQ